MKKIVLPTLIFLHTFSVVIAQKQHIKRICRWEDNNLSADTINQNYKYGIRDFTIENYLENIQYVFKTNVNCQLLVNDSIKGAEAGYLNSRYPRKDENYQIPIIEINKKYYESKFSDNVDKQIALMLVLAHELNHHINHHTDVPQEKFTTYKQEIIADRKAGYALGKLYPNVPSTKIEKIVEAILINNSFSGKHPPKNYRILAVKCGFLEAILEGKPFNKIITLQGRKYYKERKEVSGQVISIIKELGHFVIIDYLDNHDFIIGETRETNIKSAQMGLTGKVIYITPKFYKGIYFSNEEKGLQGKEYAIFSNGNSLEIDFKNDNKRGKGVYTYTNGERYIGDFFKHKRNGYGEYYESDSTIYKGFWKDGNKNGKGIQSKDGKILYDGCWENNKFQNTKECDSNSGIMPDSEFDCLTGLGPAWMYDCTDTDGDEVADLDDECPTQAGPAFLNGCPDTDGDEIADKDDACPLQPGLDYLMGCPDTDGDEIADKDDACPKQAGSALLNGCPDKDNDGIADDKDKCPEMLGLKNNDGCPEGYINGDAPIKVYRTESGCKIPVEELDSLNIEIRNIEFYSGTNKLKISSYKAIEHVYNILYRCPNAVLSINVYNDIKNNNAPDLNLAKARAYEVYSYLVEKKKIIKTRLQHNGLADEGSQKSYTNAEGKRVDSRLEFLIR